MEYTSTRNCLDTILRTMGTLEVAQIERFFRNAPDIQNLKLYINRFVGYHIFDYNDARGRLTYHNFPGTVDDTINRRITAFWIPVSFGYDNVREITLLSYPSQIMMISEDNDCYDITVCRDEKEARNAVRMRKRLEVTGMPDDVNHIAIVKSEALGRKILPYGFDSFCILDDDKVPTYYNE